MDWAGENRGTEKDAPVAGALTSGNWETAPTAPRDPFSVHVFACLVTLAAQEAIASGAIPFVHDSGGQREIVNNPELRFEDKTFFDKFDSLLKWTDAEMQEARAALNQHVQTFSEENYIKAMLAYFFDDASGETDTEKRVVHYADDHG